MSLRDLVVCVGEVTLAAGTATIANTAIQAGDIPVITCSKATGAAYVSAPSYSAITTAGQLVITGLSLANPAAVVNTDVSLITYAILRPFNTFGSA